MSDDLTFRFANAKDVPWLAKRNQELILDEGSRNKMSIIELEQRMSNFLGNEYKSVIMSFNNNDVGYILYRQDTDHLYIRQLFIIRNMRRRYFGRKFIEWLKKNAWKDCKIISTEVLIHNRVGIDFWKAVGFKDYCITMEMENQ